MIFIPVTEIKTVEDLLKKVEQGEICVITKEGEPFFELFPLKTREKPRWKRKMKRIKLKGDKTSTEIIREVLCVTHSQNLVFLPRFIT